MFSPEHISFLNKGLLQPKIYNSAMVKNCHITVTVLFWHGKKVTNDDLYLAG